MSSKTKNNPQNLSIPDDIAHSASIIFGSTAQAELWLSTPIHALNGDAPISKLKTGDGAAEVRAILNKIKSGEFT